MRDVREAACKLSLVCLGIDPALISDRGTALLLPKTTENFEALLAKLDQ